MGDEGMKSMWGTESHDVSVPFWILILIGFFGLLVVLFMWLGMTGQQDLVLGPMQAILEILRT